MSATTTQLALHHEVQQLLYLEARLIDQRRFDEWLDLFTDDLRYWMPARSSRYARNSRAITIGDAEHYDESELTGEGEFSLLDESKQTLAMRIARLRTGMAWAEEPASRTRRFVSNVEIQAAGAEITAYSNFLMYRNRLETEQDFFVGRRIDTLRRVEDRLKIAARQIILDQNVLLAKNLVGLF